MGFSYADGGTGITVNGQDLAEFSAKLLSEYKLGACGLQSETLQGDSRSSMLLLRQKVEPLELRLPLEFWGNDRRDTAEKWSRFCGAFSGEVTLDLRDGFLYRGCGVSFGEPLWLTDEWMSSEVTFRGMRQKPEVVVSMEAGMGQTLLCSSTFPKTDCTVTLTVPAETREVCLRLGKQEWYLYNPTGQTQVWVLDGISKQFLLNGEPVAGHMVWEDFPCLEPGENAVAVFLDTIDTIWPVEVRYYPTFL